MTRGKRLWHDEGWTTLEKKCYRQKIKQALSSFRPLTGPSIQPTLNGRNAFSTPRIKTSQAAGRKKAGSPRPERTWDVTVPMVVRAMVLANKTLFVAGPPAGQGVEGLAKLTTIQPGILWAVSCADGKKLSEYKLPASPVLDGMAVAPNRLLFTCTDGTVRCLTG